MGSATLDPSSGLPDLWVIPAVLFGLTWLFIVLAGTTAAVLPTILVAIVLAKAANRHQGVGKAPDHPKDPREDDAQHRRTHVVAKSGPAHSCTRMRELRYS